MHLLKKEREREGEGEGDRERHSLCGIIVAVPQIINPGEIILQSFGKSCVPCVCNVIPITVGPWKRILKRVHKIEQNPTDDHIVVKRDVYIHNNSSNSHASQIGCCF